MTKEITKTTVNNYDAHGNLLSKTETIVENYVEVSEDEAKADE